MPTCPVHLHNGMSAPGNGAADFVEVKLHGVGVRLRHHDGGPDTSRRADGAEQVGVLIALIGGLARPRARAGPQSDKAVLLPDPCFVLEPQLNRGSWRQISYVGMEGAGKVFLNASITFASCLGCCGRALMWEKPRSCRICDTQRSP